MFKKKKTPNLSVVLYGCETKLFALKEELISGDSENRVLRKAFEPKRKVN
jgi:hypothetical protein